MKQLKRISRLAIATLLASLLVGLTTVSAQDQKVLRVAMGAAGTTVIWDVALATDTTSHTFSEMMFVGLAPRDETTGLPQHGMAEQEISEDGRVYL